MTPAELSRRYADAISTRTLANWRSNGTGPAFVKVGGKVLYSLAAVVEWEGSRQRRGKHAQPAVA